jgi:hypothetical protein
MNTKIKVGCHTYKSKKKSEEHPEKIYVHFTGYILQGNFTGYPSNHFSGCRLNGRLFETILEVSMDVSDKACHLFVARSNDGDKKQESNEPVPCMPRSPLFFAHYPLGF